VYSSGLSLGSLCAALAGGAIAQWLGWRATFYVLGATGLVFAYLFPLVVPEPPRTTRWRARRVSVNTPVSARPAHHQHIVAGTTVGGLMVTA